MRLASDELLQLAWTQAWQIAVVVIAVAVVVKLACRPRPHLAYLLWMLVIVKAITPPVWSSPTGAFSWARAETIAVQTTRARVPSISPGIAITPPEQRAVLLPPPSPIATVPEPAVVPEAPLPFTPGTWILLTWLAGSLAVVALVLVRWLRLLAQLRRTSRPADDGLQRQFDELRKQLGLRRSVRLVVTSDNLGPAAFGWWRGTVLLPQAVVEQSQPNELITILAHELVHVRRFDPLAGGLQLAVQCLWWFHPAVWWANRQIRVERERACDEEVLADLACSPADYTRLLVRILSWRQRFVPAVFWSGMRSWDVTSDRLRHVLEAKAFQRRAPRWCWLVVIAGLAVTLPGAGLQSTTNAIQPEPLASGNPANSNGSQPDAASQSPTSNADKSAEESLAIKELRSLGVEVELVRYSSESMRSWGMSGTGKLDFAPADPIPDGQFATFAYATLPVGFRPDARQLPLSTIPNLSRLQVGVSLSALEPSAVAPTEQQLRAQLLSLQELLPTTTLNVVYTKENAGALDALASIPRLERLALWPTTLNRTASQGVEMPLRLNRLPGLRSFFWTGDNFLSVAFDTRLAEIATLSQLETLVLHGSMSEPALDQLAALSHMRSLTLVQWEAGKPLNLVCIDGMPELEELTVSGLAGSAAARIGKLTHLRYLASDISAVTDEGLQKLTGAKQLRRLDLNASFGPVAATSAGLAALGALENLEDLRLNGFFPAHEPLTVTDASLSGWKGLHNLRRLQLQSCDISDESLRVLGKLSALSGIQLNGKLDVTDRGVAELGQLSKLQALILPGSKVTGSGLNALAGMTDLRALSLTGAPLDDRGMLEIAKLKNLQQLDVSKTAITDRGLGEISGKLPSLERLDLSETNVTDKGLAFLMGRRTLRDLDVIGTNLSLKSVDRLLDDNHGLRIWVLDPENPQSSPPNRYRGAFPQIDLVHTDLMAMVQRSKSAVAQSSAAETSTDDAIARLAKLGLHVASIGEGDGRQLFADFEKSFVALDEPLPLEELPGLKSIAINDRLDLNEEQLVARLKAVRQLRPETMLLVFFTPGQGAAFNLLAEIPGLRKLGIMSELPSLGRTLKLGDLKQLQQLTLVDDLTNQKLEALAPLADLEELQLYQSKPYATLDFASLENKPKLKRLMTGGIRPTNAAFARIGELGALEILAIDVASATDVGIAPLANLANLKTLTLSSSGAKSQVTPAGLRVIGKLSNLKNITLSAEFSSSADGGEALTDQIVVGWPEQLEGLKLLQVFDCELGDAGLVSMSRLPSLEHLTLFGKVQVSDSARSALGTMTKLRHLSMPDPDLNDGGLALLRNLTNLETLSLVQCKLVTDAGLSVLADLTKLKKLSIQYANLEGSGFAALEKLAQLEAVSVGSNPIDDAGVETIVRLKGLLELDLKHTKITDEALTLIGRNLPELTKLNISDTSVTDAGLAALKPLKRLRSVVANGTKITNAKNAGLTASVTSGSNLVYTGELEVFSLEAE